MPITESARIRICFFLTFLSQDYFRLLPNCETCHSFRLRLLPNLPDLFSFNRYSPSLAFRRFDEYPALEGLGFCTCGFRSVS